MQIISKSVTKKTYFKNILDSFTFFCWDHFCIPPPDKTVILATMDLAVQGLWPETFSISKKSHGFKVKELETFQDSG